MTPALANNHNALAAVGSCFFIDPVSGNGGVMVSPRRGGVCPLFGAGFLYRCWSGCHE